MKGLSNSQLKIVNELVNSGISKISAGVFEKDFMTTEAIRIATSISSDDVQIVFCGGTSLAKAHKIIGRMSEDADFRVIVHDENTPSHNRKLMGEIKRRIFEALRDSGFELTKEHCKAADSNNNIQFTVPYANSFSLVTSLRPSIKMDFIKMSPMDDTIIKAISPLAEETLGIAPNYSFEVPCMGVRETLAEKTVALLRRLSDERESFSDDIRLVRHLYDIERIINIGGFNWEPRLQELFNAKILEDSQKFATHCTDFAADPAKTMNTTLAELKSLPTHAANYANILSDLVFERDPPDFESAMTTFENLAERLISGISPEEGEYGAPSY
jgi:hypothetical protein